MRVSRPLNNVKLDEFLPVAPCAPRAFCWTGPSERPSIYGLDQHIIRFARECQCLKHSDFDSMKKPPRFFAETVIIALPLVDAQLPHIISHWMPAIMFVRVSDSFVTVSANNESESGISMNRTTELADVHPDSILGQPSPLSILLPTIHSESVCCFPRPASTEFVR